MNAYARAALLVGLFVVLLAPMAQADQLEIPFEAYELENGLQVILSEDHDNPLTHVELWYHVGSKDEPEGRSGFAHLFEHLMFEGSAHYDHDFFSALQPLGARVNGSTSTDRTNYYETLPSNGLERALWMEADRMGFLLEVLTHEKLEIQKDVVRNERRQNYEEAPYGDSRRAIAEALWPAEHPYHRLTIGSHEDIDAATLDDVRTFFRTWYVPNNATLVVSGDFEPTQTKAWIERYFGPLPAGDEPASITEAEAPLPAATTVELTDDVQLPRVYMAWQTMPLYAEGDADLDVLSSILTSGKGSRLHKRLVFDDRIAKDVSAYQASSELGSSYKIIATVAPDHTVEEVIAAIEDELAKLAEAGVTKDEVEQSVNNWRKRFYGRVESVAGRGSNLHSYNHHTGDPGFVQQDLERYLAVTSESVHAWATKVLDPAHRVTVIVRPEPEPEPEPDAADEGGAQ
jgi:zinc protease